MKLRPVDTQSDGIFICGMAHSPKRIDESISQALAASARACRLLSQDSIEVGGVVARVDQELCAACLICVRACPYEVPFINDDVPSVTAAYNGARDIVAQSISDDPDTRDELRQLARRRGKLNVSLADEGKDAKGVYQLYYN